MNNLPVSLNYILGYSATIVFLVAIIIYLYMIITEKIENKETHTIEENVWIYGLFAVLIIGFIISYYTISYCKNKSSSTRVQPNSNQFSGEVIIPTKSFGHKNISKSKFTI